MIHEVDGCFTISSGGTWLSGAYATRKAAHLAFQLPDLTLAQLEARANARAPGGIGGVITEAEVRRLVSGQARDRAANRAALAQERARFQAAHKEDHDA